MLILSFWFGIMSDAAPAVALAFEEMHTPYASGREKFGNVYQWKEIEKQMLHFKSTFTTEFIKRFSEVICSSQTMHTFLSHACVCSVIVCIMFCVRYELETKSRFLAYAALITSMILRTARFLCVIYAEISVLKRYLCARFSHQGQVPQNQTKAHPGYSEILHLDLWSNKLCEFERWKTRAVHLLFQLCNAGQQLAGYKLTFGCSNGQVDKSKLLEGQAVLFQNELWTVFYQVQIAVEHSCTWHCHS